ncbi:MAG: hypothetical protein HYU66_21910, partial [Armatimonadetes bacterium]|nr:hypothetical protein [Armatimonadota bacterium]
RALSALARLQQVTRERRYLEPLRRGVAWLEPLRREDGSWPAAVDRESGATPEGTCPERLVQSCLVLVKETLLRPGTAPREPSREDRARISARRGPAVARLIATLDAEGRWVEDGRVSLAQTAANLAELAQYVREYEPPSEQMEGDEERRPPQHSLP